MPDIPFGYLFLFFVFVVVPLIERVWKAIARGTKQAEGGRKGSLQERLDEAIRKTQEKMEEELGERPAPRRPTQFPPRPRPRPEPISREEEGVIAAPPTLPFPVERAERPRELPPAPRPVTHRPEPPVEPEPFALPARPSAPERRRASTSPVPGLKEQPRAATEQDAYAIKPKRGKRGRKGYSRKHVRQMILHAEIIGPPLAMRKSTLPGDQPPA